MKLCEFGSWVPVIQPRAGNEVYLYQISKALAGIGHDVDLYILGDSKRSEVVDGFDVHYIPMPWLMRKLTTIKSIQGIVYRWGLPNAFKLLFALLPTLANSGKKDMQASDAVLVHYADEIFPLLYSRLLRKPSILITHVLHSVWAASFKGIVPFGSYWLKYIYYSITDYIGLRLANIVFVTSEKEKKVALAKWRFLTEEKVQVAANGVDIDEFCVDMEARNYIRRQHHIPDASQVIGFTSGMKKDVTNLATGQYIVNELCYKIWKEYPDTCFLIVGDHIPGSLGNIDDPRIIVTGFVESLPPYLNAIDIAIAPYKIGRGAKIKTIEAMACGKVVVATQQSIGGFEVENEKHAVICDFDDFSETLLRVIKDFPTISPVISRQARDLIVRKYSWKTIAHQMTDLITDKLMKE